MLIEVVLGLNYLTDRNRRIKLYGYGGNVLVVGCGDTANGKGRLPTKALIAPLLVCMEEKIY